MNMCTYGAVTETYSLAGKSRTAYGIAVYAHAEGDGISSVVASVPDVTLDKTEIDHLVCLCNTHHLDPEQLCDIIHDFLAS